MFNARKLGNHVSRTHLVPELMVRAAKWDEIFRNVISTGSTGRDVVGV